MKKQLVIALIAVVVVLGLCYALAAVRPNLPPTLSAPFTAASTTTAGASLSTPRPARANDPVVMHVNAEPVTASEFEAYLQQAPEQMQPFYSSPEGRRLFAQEIVKFKALAQEGRRLGVERDPDAMMRIDMATSNIIASYALQKLAKKPDDARLRAEYEKEKPNLDAQQLSHILIAYKGGAVPARGGVQRSYEDAMKKAGAIEAQLRSGADFAQLARVESDDSGSAANGGNLGPIAPGSLPPELQPAVRALKEGQASKPVRSSFGVHIFKAGKHESRGFDEMKPMFAAKLQREEAEAAVTRLQKAAKVELDPKYFPPAPQPSRGKS